MVFSLFLGIIYIPTVSFSLLGLHRRDVNSLTIFLDFLSFGGIKFGKLHYSTNLSTLSRFKIIYKRLCNVFYFNKNVYLIDIHSLPFLFLHVFIYALLPD